MTATRLLDFLYDNARTQPQRLCIQTTSGRYTYRELATLVSATAARLTELGIRRNTRVALYTDDDMHLCRAMFAVWSLGAVAIPINVTFSEDRIQAMETLVNPDMGFTAGTYRSDRTTSFPRQPLPNCELTAQASRVVTDLGDDDPLAAILFTSGSSGVPKAVPLNASQLLANALGTAQRLSLGREDRILITTPFYTTSSMMHFFTLLTAGGGVVIERGFLFGDRVLEILEQHHCTGFGGVPVNFIRLSPALESGRAPPRSLRFIMNSGEHLPEPLIRLFRHKWPTIELFCVYGLTEVAGRLCILDADKIDLKIGSVGQPLTGMEVSVRNENGVALPANEVGEVVVAGPNLAAGYLADAKTNISWTPFGFRTGDLGWLDDDGDLYLVGREDDVVKVGGEKVSMLVIESAAGSLRGVRECAAVAVADPRMGTVPWLYVRANETLADTTDLQTQLRDLLPANHVPMKIIALDSLPRTSSGKIARKELNRLAAAQASAGSG